MIGTFAFYFREPRGPTETEREVVAVGSNLCAIALNLETRRAEVERLVFTDALTGLGNRASFEAALAAHDYKAAPDLAIMIIDVDDLKVINDTFGARVGDSLLRIIAHRIGQAAQSARVFRLGGDEFAVVTTGIDAAGTEELGRRMLRSIRRSTSCEGHRLTPSASIGLALRDPADIGGELTRQNAYLALYAAKEERRGRLVRYRAEQRTRVATRLKLIGQLHRAINDQRLFPAYQPIVDMRTGEITGVEALCRLRCPNGHVTTAGEFAEALTDGLAASRVTRAMISQIARDLQSWRDQGIAPGHVAINLSTADFVDDSVAAQIEELLCVGHEPLRGVVVEITESVYLGRSNNQLLDHIARLKEKGAKIALDDFGTGFASLTHLLSMPIDILKIDKAFVDGLLGDGSSAPIIDGLVRITDRLGIQIVAEGVETEPQALALVALGCYQGQGYLFSRALPQEAMSRLLREQALRHANLRTAA